MSATRSHWNRSPTMLRVRDVILQAATLREAPPKWRTVLVDRETGLPAYDIITLTSELDSPTLKTRHTYPRRLAIEPPVQ